MVKKKETGLITLDLKPSPLLAQYVEDEHKLFGNNPIALLEYLMNKYLAGHIQAVSIRQIYVKATQAQAFTDKYSVIPENIQDLLPCNTAVKRFRVRKIKEITYGVGCGIPSYVLQSKIKVPGFYVTKERHENAKLEFSLETAEEVYNEIRKTKHRWGDIRKVRFTLPDGLEIDFTYGAASSEDFPVLVTADYEYTCGNPQRALRIFKSSTARRLREYLWFITPNSVAKDLLKNYWFANNPEKIVKKLLQYETILPSKKDSTAIRQTLKQLIKQGS